MHSAKTKLLLLLAALLALLGGCSMRGQSAAPAVSPTPAPAATPAPLYTVTYEALGEVLRTEEVAQGQCPAPFEEPDCGGRLFLGWADERGDLVSPYALPVSGDVTYTASLAPSLRRDVFYFPAEGGLFRPDDALSRQELAVLLHTLMEEPFAVPAGLLQEPLYDLDILPAQCLYLYSDQITPAAGAYVHPTETEPPVIEPDPAYQTLAGACEAGFLSGTDEQGSLRPHEAVTRAEFTALLERFFRPGAVAAAIESTAEGALTRYEAARALNTLLEREDEDSGAVFPDVAEDDERLSVLRAASEGGESAQGMLLLSNGRLYYIGEDGLCLRDGDVGRLHFDENGRYTSGDAALDALVTPMIAAVVDARDTHEAQLRAVYDYVRDHFVYLRCNYYDMGEHGWEIAEATDFLDRHLGNCYSFTAGLWALARGIGYDAQAISGFQGENTSPHGWVDITLEDGVRYFFDVEAEYAALRDGAQVFPMFKLPWSSATVLWTYKFDWGTEGFPIT